MKRARLGIDLRELRGSGTGIGRWIRNFLSVRPILAAEVEVVGFGAHTDGVSAAVAGPPVFWSGTTLNRILDNERVGLWLSPYYKIPPGLAVDSIATIHDLIPARIFPRKYYFALRIRHTLRNAWKIATVSEETRRVLEREYHFDPRRIILARNAVGECFRQERCAADSEVLERFGLSSREFFLAVLDDRPHKNLEMLLRVFAAEPLRLLVVVGSSRSDVPSNVRCLGRISDDVLGALYRHAVALLHPAFEEGFGLPPLEALASGTPIVVSDIPVMREIAGAEAIFVSPDDIDGWRRAVAGGFPADCLFEAAGKFRAEETSRDLWNAIREKLLG